MEFHFAAELLELDGFGFQVRASLKSSMEACETAATELRVA